MEFLQQAQAAPVQRLERLGVLQHERMVLLPQHEHVLQLLLPQRELRWKLVSTPAVAVPPPSQPWSELELHPSAMNRH